MSERANVSSLSRKRSQRQSGGDRGGGSIENLEARLRDVEFTLVGLESKTESVATREDIEKLKTSLLEKDVSRDRWLIGVLISAILAISLAVIRTFLAS